jgi:hypothetical protein
VTPRWSFGFPDALSVFAPRLQLGGAVNLSGKTSFAYLDVLWTFPVGGGVFVEGFVGPSIHNGTMVPSLNHTGLGCPILFHAGASVGYRFNDRWSVLATFEHLSNGKGAFGIDCGTNQGEFGNQGLNNFGARVGYTF